mgnify:CR=1 FL=1
MIEIGRRRKTQKEEAMVTFDGRSAQELETGDRIEIYKAQETTQLIRIEKGRSVLSGIIAEQNRRRHKGWVL